MVSLARQQFLAVAKNKEFGNINFVAIYYEESASRNPCLPKNIPEQKSTVGKQYKNAESFEINCTFFELL